MCNVRGQFKNCLQPTNKRCGMTVFAIIGKKIGLNEVQLGLAVPSFIAQLMTITIGQRQGELALTQGKMFMSEDACKIGKYDKC